MSIDRRYWDSDCFLSWLQAEAGKAHVCEAVLEEAENGRVLLVTSALTLAEVLYLRDHTPIPREHKQKVIDFFKNEYIAVRNVTRRVAEEARELVWENGVKPKDAIHVATALHDDLDILNTFDQKLIAKSGVVGNPLLRIERPQPPAQGKLPLE